MKVIGITGGVGSGKSAVLAWMEQEYGACICQKCRFYDIQRLSLLSLLNNILLHPFQHCRMHDCIQALQFFRT